MIGLLTRRAGWLPLLLAAAAAAAETPTDWALAASAPPGAPSAPSSSAPSAAEPAGQGGAALGVLDRPGWAQHFSAQAGWGYYEVTHAGVAWHLSDGAALGLFGGYGAAGGARTATLGLSFAQDLFRPVKTLQPGWSLKAIYWTRSDDAYDWTNVSLVLGARVSKELGPRLRLALDGGVALTGALTTDRKQNEQFGHPERWNGSLCLEIAYLLGAP